MSAFHTKILNITADQTHGSSVLLNDIILALDDPSLTIEELEWAFDELASVDSSMVIVHHFLREMRLKLGKSFLKSLHAYDKKWKNSEGKIVDGLMEHLHRHKLWILTHSHSGMIIGVVKYLLEKGFDIRIIQTESLPGGEGLVQADAFKEMGISVQKIKDAGVRTNLMDVDVVFLGMDQFDRSHFVNKVGSRTIVDTAERFDIPVFVLGDSRKQVDNAFAIPDSNFELVKIKRNVTLITEQPEQIRTAPNLVFNYHVEKPSTVT